MLPPPRPHPADTPPQERRGKAARKIIRRYLLEAVLGRYLNPPRNGLLDKRAESLQNKNAPLFSEAFSESGYLPTSLLPTNYFSSVIFRVAWKEPAVMRYRYIPLGTVTPASSLPSHVT